MDLYDELPRSDLLCDDEFSALLDASKQNQVSVIEFITLNAKELATILQRSINEVAKFQQLLLQEFEMQFKEMNFIKVVGEGRGPAPFTSGDVGIDEILGGGIFTHGITEVFGESSTGKSQLLMQLSLSVQLPPHLGGLSAKCVYITTEGDLSTKRLEEFIASRPDLKDNGVTQNNIFTVSCNDLMVQEHILDVQLPILLEKNKGSIRLIIIDSIAHHMRVELTSTSFKDSQDNRFYIDKMAEKLLGLADKFSLAVVVANQVSDKPLVERTDPTYQEVTDYEYQLGWMVGWKNSTILYRQKYNEPCAVGKENSLGLPSCEDILSDDEDSILIEEEFQKSKNSRKDSGIILNMKTTEKQGTKVQNFPTFSKKYKKRRIDHRVPSLGLTWANHLSTRILLKKTYKASPLVKRGEMHMYKGSDPSVFWQVRRILKVVFSTYARPREATFAISKRGIESI